MDKPNYFINIEEWILALIIGFLVIIFLGFWTGLISGMVSYFILVYIRWYMEKSKEGEDE